MRSGSIGGPTMRWLTLSFAILLVSLIAAAPALAEGRQSIRQSATCNGGDDNGGDDLDDNGSDDSGSDGDDDGGGNGGNASGGDGGRGGNSGSCRIQQRRVQQRAGGSASYSINQSQDFGDDEEDSDDDSVSTEELSCDDFSSQAAAQRAVDDREDGAEGLDADGDGRACESEFTQRVTTNAPRGGIESGGGGTLARASSETAPSALADVARVVGPALAVLLIAGGLLGLRRGRTH